MKRLLNLINASDFSEKCLCWVLMNTSFTSIEEIIQKYQTLIDDVRHNYEYQFYLAGSALIAHDPIEGDFVAILIYHDEFLAEYLLDLSSLRTRTITDCYYLSPVSRHI